MVLLTLRCVELGPLSPIILVRKWQTLSYDLRLMLSPSHSAGWHEAERGASEATVHHRNTILLIKSKSNRKPMSHL